MPLFTLKFKAYTCIETVFHVDISTEALFCIKVELNIIGKLDICSNTDDIPGITQIICIGIRQIIADTTRRITKEIM